MVGMQDAEIRTQIRSNPELETAYFGVLSSPRKRKQFPWMKEYLNYLQKRPERWERSLATNITHALKAQVLNPEFNFAEESRKVLECWQTRSPKAVTFDTSNIFLTKLQRANERLAKYEQEKLEDLAQEAKEIWQQEISDRLEASEIYKITLPQDIESKKQIQDLLQKDRAHIFEMLKLELQAILEDKENGPRDPIASWEALAISSHSILRKQIVDSRAELMALIKQSKKKGLKTLNIADLNLKIYFSEAAEIYLNHLLGYFKVLLQTTDNPDSPRSR